MTLVRTQILLTEEQVRRLRRLAKARGTSMSAIVREIMDAHLESEDEARKRRRREALARLRELSEALEREGFAPMSGEEIVEMIRQMREERTNELVRNILGS